MFLLLLLLINEPLLLFALINKTNITEVSQGDHKKLKWLGVQALAYEKGNFEEQRAISED